MQVYGDRFHVLSIIETILEDLGHSKLLKEFQYFYRSEGGLDARARA